jgi:hypothetical protein
MGYVRLQTPDVSSVDFSIFAVGEFRLNQSEAFGLYFETFG